MSAEQLSVCRWCGRSVAYVEPFNDDEYQVVCGDEQGGCGAFGPIGKTKDEAIAAWNRRALPTREELAEAMWKSGAVVFGRSYSGADAVLALLKGEA